MKIFQQKTWGPIWTAITRELNDAKKEAGRGHYGTPMFFRIVTLAVHRRFVEICRREGMGDDAIVRLRQEMSTMCRSKTMPHSQAIEDLCMSLPHEFNVRGTWTP